MWQLRLPLSGRRLLGFLGLLLLLLLLLSHGLAWLLGRWGDELLELGHLCREICVLGGELAELWTVLTILVDLHVGVLHC